MTDFSTVVAAIGDSDRAIDVLRAAGTLARVKQGDTLFYAHAAGRIPAAMEDVLFPYACLGDDAEAVRAAVLQAAARALASRWGKEMVGQPRDVLRVGYGGAVEGVLEVARAIGPDILLLGPSSGDTPGHVGPDAHAILTRAPWSVWLARARDTAPTIRNVMVALDLTPDSPHLLTTALRLAEQHGATLHPVSVAPHGGVGDHAQVTGPVREMHGKTRKSMEQLDTRVVASMSLHFPEERQLAERLKPNTLVQGDPAEELCRAAAELEADVIVIGRRQSRNGRGLGRVAEHVARHADCDVWVVPTEGPAVAEES